MMVLAVALLVTLLSMVVVLPVLRRWGVLDVPNQRSSHHAPTPRGGGIAVVLGIVAGTAVGVHQGLGFAPWVIGGVLAFAFLGLLDDLFGLSVPLRLGLQLVSAALVAVAALGFARTAGLVTVVAVIWIVAYVNAFNFMDGVNGISSLNAALAGGWYAYLALRMDTLVLLALGAAVAGASLGFLPWNAPRARVFLGDVGSYALGLAIAAAAMIAWRAGAHLLLAVAPLIVYLADTGWALASRVIRGRPWREAHREHVYQRLTDAGLSHLASATVVAGFGGLACLASLGVGVLPTVIVLALGSAVMLAYLTYPLRLAARSQPARMGGR
ncbi:MAG: hypothetical protein ACRDOY_04660 [Nocardioidaceae bacterium]